MTFDVSGWQPNWLTARDQLRAHAVMLKELRGQCITHAWIVWDNQHDKWFADLPVVVRFEDGRQLEVCWQKFGDLSTTWNTIDVEVTPIAWATWPLTWRPNGHLALDLVIRDTLTDAAVRSISSRRGRSLPPERLRRQPTPHGYAGGSWLQARQAGLHTFNALDENSLSNDEPGQESSQRWIDL